MQERALTAMNMGAKGGGETDIRFPFPFPWISGEKSKLKTFPVQ
jgi:hypothetical protein